jgi:hypothetical protein
MNFAKEVHMAMFRHPGNGPTLESDRAESHKARIEARIDDQTISEPADYELDDRLRTLRLDQWFVMADEGMPIWAC